METEIKTQTNLTKVVNEIFKDKIFKYDTMTGYYYINNYDISYLFEFKPSNMELKVSIIIKDYLKYRNVYNHNIEKILLSEICKYSGMRFINLSFTTESTINLLKLNSLSSTIRSSSYSNKLCISNNYFDIDRIDLLRCGTISKTITSDFENIDISNLENGYYLIFIHVKGKFKGRNLGTIRIKNNIEEHDEEYTI